MARITDPWLCLDQNPLLYEKEILPVGPLTRWVGDDKEILQANVKLPFLKRVAEKFKKFRQHGIAAHCYKTIVEHPENNQGYIKDAYIKKNSKCVDSLHVRVLFHDAKAKKSALRNEVSALIPTKFVDHKNNSYDHP